MNRRQQQAGKRNGRHQHKPRRRTDEAVDRMCGEGGGKRPDDGCSGQHAGNIGTHEGRKVLPLVLAAQLLPDHKQREREHRTGDDAQFRTQQARLYGIPRKENQAERHSHAAKQDRPAPAKQVLEGRRRRRPFCRCQGRWRRRSRLTIEFLPEVRFKTGSHGFFKVIFPGFLLRSRQAIWHFGAGNTRIPGIFGFRVQRFAGRGPFRIGVRVDPQLKDEQTALQTADKLAQFTHLATLSTQLLEAHGEKNDNAQQDRDEKCCHGTCPPPVADMEDAC